jgi:hypothetical protein
MDGKTITRFMREYGLFAKERTLGKEKTQAIALLPSCFAKSSLKHA